MRIATWNVNSIRARLDRLLAWLDRTRPDVVALQETKVRDEDFPREAIAAAGYRAEVHGQKTFNGVALLSREPAADVRRGFGDPEDEEDEQRRLIAARYGDVHVVGVYVPNGEAVDSPKFPYKLAWLERLERYLAAHHDPGETLLLLGDFYIAPDDRDVYDPEAWRGQVLFHPDEHAALARLRAWGLRDLLRVHDDRPGRYTWWDYRQLGFPKNRGLRIDLVLGTASAAERCRAVTIDRDERKGQKPSDHAPVVAWLDEDPDDA